MANWSPLRDALASVVDRVTFGWSDLDALVGGLPPSAYNHAAFWKGDRSGWPGFTTVEVRVGTSVTFIRRSSGAPLTLGPQPTPHDSMQVRRPTPADIVLIGCVKQKLQQPAEARNLYTSPLFRKERAYAEAAGCLWFILSAEHGLVVPTTVLEPYDLRLSSTPHDYRQRWGRRVVDQLREAVAPLTGKVIEVHAGSAYTNAIREGLANEGVVVVEPLQGLTMGERLAWYLRLTPTHPTGAPETSDVMALVEQLGRHLDAVSPGEFLARGGAGMRGPGLYSWWVDESGARELTLGVGHPIRPGLIYAGLAGATRSRSGRPSKNTLWGRIRGMHLGGRHEFSTFRLSLGSILANAGQDPEINEGRLTAWMYEHLRVVAIPVTDADALDGMETEVLLELGPPLNLSKMSKSLVRAKLTELRRRYSRKVRPDSE
jgi:hypothetical protein